MAELLSYQGNAGLGIGSGKGAAPLGPNDNLSVIQNTGRDIMLLDAERNMKIFQQKVNDRDNLSNLILKNQVSAGEIDPKYRKDFDDASSNVKKLFTEWGGNPNDTKGYSKYQEGVTHLQDVATHAQTNTIELKKLIQQRSQETLPWKQKALDDHIAKQQSKDFWDHVDPYQQMFSFSIDPILKLYKTGTTTSMSPDGLFKYDDTYGDFQGTLKNAQNEYLNHGETSEDMRQWLGQVEAYNPVLKKQLIDSLNGQLQKYNTERNVQPGQPGYADPIELVIGPDNKYHIKSDPATFAAKYALANQEKYLTRSQSFNKDFGAFGLNRAKLELQGRKLGLEAEKAHAYARNLNAKTEKWLKDNKDQSTQIEQQYQQFVDNIKPRGIAITDKKSKKLDGNVDAVFLNDLPESFQYINGPIAGMKVTTTKDGKKTETPTGKVEVGKLEPYKDSKGNPYYIPRYVNPQTGERMTLDDGYLKSQYKTGRKNGFAGSYDDYVRILLKKGAIEMMLQGQNGTANYTSMYQSAKVLNNEASKKGQENIMNPPAEEPDADNTPDQ